jgi:5-(aminomethyl)-3-furanmethanol phosphate kinase
MAIAAMEQYGWYLSSLGIPATAKPEFCGRPTVFLPYIFLREKNPLSHSWDITSDTISAWIASYLSAPLLILKSIDKIRADGREIDEIREEIKTTDLDPAFIPFAQKRQISCQIVNGTNEQRLLAALNNKLVPGTRLSNTI